MSKISSKRAQELDARIRTAEREHAAKVAEQEVAHKARVNELKEATRQEEERLELSFAQAGRNRSDFVESLYETMGVTATEKVARRNKRTGEVLLDRHGNPRMHNPDAGETDRLRRLLHELIGEDEEAAEAAAEPVEQQAVQPMQPVAQPTSQFEQAAQERSHEAYAQ